MDQKRRKKKKRFFTVAERQNYILIVVSVCLVIAALGTVLGFLGQYGFSFLAFLKGEDGKQTIQVGDHQTAHDLVDKTNLFIIGEADGGEYMRFYTLLQINLESGTLSVCSLPTTLSIGDQTLTDVYRNSGGAAAKEALATYLGIRIDRYIAITDSSYKKVISKLGEPTYSFAERIKYSTSGDDAYAVRIRAGEQELDGSQLLKLYRYSGEYLKDFKLQNELIAAAVSAVLTEENYEKSEVLFNTMLNDVDTDMVIDDYANKKEALEALCSPGYRLSSQPIETDGSYGADGAFTMSADMLQEVKTLFYKER